MKKHETHMEDYEHEHMLHKEMAGKGAHHSLAGHMAKHHAGGAKAVRKQLADARAEHGMNAEQEDPEFGGQGGL
jgi:hypothetical protein